MTTAARERRQVWMPALFISVAAWLALVIEPGGTALVTHCSAEMLDATPSNAALKLLAALSPPTTLAMGWVLMLAAMMVPLLVPPVRHVRDSSFSRRRARAIVLFVAAYVAIWMAGGAMLLAIATTARLVAPASPVAAAVMIGALVWQFSPIKQRCLNRCHFHPELRAFGFAADRDALRFGLAHGAWCVGSCWALMLPPLVVSRGHLAVMAAVALWLAAERLERPVPPRWRWRGPSKAARMLVARTQMRLQRS
jgi:predicted metal-binding membrane protein